MVREVPTIFPVLVEGERIRLREVNIDDFEATWQWASRAEFFRFLPIDQPTRDEERAWLDSIVAQAHEIPRRQYHLGIKIVDGSKLIGMVRLAIDSQRHRSASIAYGISPEHWGHGYATEAAQLIVGFAFDALGLHRVWASHHPDNIASRKVLEKVGLREEGRQRDDRFVGGVWYDSVVCSILEDEWRLKRGSLMSNSGPE
jgi:RimJ/RimL family protein N-acetyltransferase